MQRTILLALALLPLTGNAAQCQGTDGNWHDYNSPYCQSPAPAVRSQAKNLLNQQMTDWIAASSKDRMLAAFAGARQLLKNQSPTDLKVVETGAALESCVTEASKTPASHSLSVAQAMAACWMLLKK